MKTKTCCKGNKGISHANSITLKLLQKAEVWLTTLQGAAGDQVCRKGNRPVSWINHYLKSNPPQHELNPRVFYRAQWVTASHTAVETNCIDKPTVIKHCRDKGSTVTWTDVIYLSSVFLAPDFVQGRNIHNTSEFPLVSGNSSSHQSRRSASLCGFSEGIYVYP